MRVYIYTYPYYINAYLSIYMYKYRHVMIMKYDKLQTYIILVREVSPASGPTYWSSDKRDVYPNSIFSRI